jgi:hypothetical protein
MTLVTETGYPHHHTAGRPIRHDAAVTDDDLLERQAALQARADEVARDLDVMALAGIVGRPTRTGSSALGLMVRRDIDITTVGDLDVERIFALGQRLATHPRVWRITFRNDTGTWNKEKARYPDGLYWLVEYVDEAGDPWTLDLWFLAEGTTQFDLEHMKSLPQRLTPDARAAILRIKVDRQAHAAPAAKPPMPSYEIYEAVLDHGVRTPAEFERYIAERPAR